MKILVTGASGYIGSQLINHLLDSRSEQHQIIGTDIRVTESNHANYQFLKGDLTKNDVKQMIIDHQPEVVVHLAAIVAPTPAMTREFIYDVEVNGTKRILEGCLAANVKKIVVTSSGAAYGYYADNPKWLKEEDVLRGNKEFAYAFHKRLQEELLEEFRKSQPQLKQVILRVGTILGKDTDNDITNLFKKPIVLGVNGTDTPFVIIWDKDLIKVLTKTILENVEGVYNIAGDGIMEMKEMATLIGKKFIQLPSALIRFILSIAKPLKLMRYGPEQVKFIEFRPVLANTKMKEELGFIPEKTARKAFMYYASENGLLAK